MPIAANLIFAFVGAAIAGPLAVLVVRTSAGKASTPQGIVVVGATAALFAWGALTAPGPEPLAATLLLAWVLLCLSLIDAATLRLPDLLTLPLIAVGLIVALRIGAPIVDHLLGAVIGYSTLALLSWAYWRMRGTDGIGLGDAKLLAAAGAWLGWEALPTVVLIACTIALAWFAAERIRVGASVRGSPIAFGAPLSAALWLVWLYGPLVT